MQNLVMTTPVYPVTIELHYGGKFIWEPNIKYMGSEVEYIQDCDRKMLSCLYFQQLYHTQLGKNGACSIYYRLPGVSLDICLRVLKEDIDVLEMINVYEELDVICMYIVKERADDDGYMEPTIQYQNQSNIHKCIAEPGIEEDIQAHIQTNCDQVEHNERESEEEFEEDEDKPPSVHSSVPSWYDEGLEVPNDDIFGNERVRPASRGPDLYVEDWWSESGDPEHAEELKSQSGSEDEKSDEFTPQVFRRAMVRWNVLRGHDIKYMKNENKMITAKCKQSCGWRIHASPISTTSTFQIKSFIPEHTCGRRHENHLVNSRYLAEEYLDDLRDNDEMRVTTMKRKARKDLNVEVSKWQCYRAREKVKKIVEGDIKKQYGLLRDYCETVMQHNPGSCFIIQTANVEINGTEPTFLRLYARLAAQKAGYLAACRPIVGLDGCFLKGAVGGQLLSAICRDGNDNLFPLAIAVVESECKETWTWFLTEFLRDMGGVEERGWVFISDRQKGLVETINELMPGVEHRFCIRHMYANFKQKYKGKELKDLFWKAASTANFNDWKCYMEEIKKADPPKVVNGEESDCAFKWLMNANPQNRARSHFSTRAVCDILVNNMNESWNNYIIDARDMHIISMLEWIRKALMIRFQVKRAGMLKHVGKVGPNIFKKLERIKNASANCFPTWSGGMIFEVECYEGVHVRQCSVNLESKTCTCRMWDVSGIPCKHAISAIFLNKQQPEDYVHSCFSREAYLATYNFQIFSVPGEHDYVKTGLPQLLPRVMKKQPGRPKKKRNKAADEPPQSKSSKPLDPTRASRKHLLVTCAKCLKTGHNKRGCKGEMHPNSKLLKPKNAKSGGVKRNSVSAQVHVSQNEGNRVKLSQPPFQNPFASRHLLATNTNSSQQPLVSQSQFQNPFLRQSTSQTSILHGPNGALFQRSKRAAIGGRKVQQTGKTQGKDSSKEEKDENRQIQVHIHNHVHTHFVSFARGIISSFVLVLLVE